MKKYEIVILDGIDQKKIFGKKLSFRNGFVNEPIIDYHNVLESYLCQPVVSVRQSGRDSCDEIIVVLAKGWIKNGKVVLDYDNAEDIKDVLTDIFTECENDEYEVFDFYESTCSKKVWASVKRWVHDTY